MKNYISTIAILVVAVTLGAADKHKIIRNRIAAPIAVLDGAPPERAAINERVPEDYKLTDEDIARGYELLTDEEFTALRDATQEAHKAYERQLETVEITRAEFIDRINDADLNNILNRIRDRGTPEDQDLARRWISMPDLIVLPPGRVGAQKATKQLRTALAAVGFGNNKLDRWFATQ